MSNVNAFSVLLSIYAFNTEQTVVIRDQSESFEHFDISLFLKNVVCQQNFEVDFLQWGSSLYWISINRRVIAYCFSSAQKETSMFLYVFCRSLWRNNCIKNENKSINRINNIKCRKSSSLIVSFDLSKNISYQITESDNVMDLEHLIDRKKFEII